MTGPHDPTREQPLVAIEQLVSEPALYTAEQIADLSELGEEAYRFWRGLGFPDAPPGERVYREDDLEMLRLLKRLLDLGVAERGTALQMARVIGSSMARIASAQVEALESRDAGMAGSGTVDVEVLASAMPRILDYAWRRHIEAAVRRRLTDAAEGEGGQRRAAVGFGDLVGFTALSQQLSEQELIAVVDRFEVLAYDTVASLGGRVVKMIGDEVMFTVDDVGRAVDIALSLAEAYHDDEALTDVRVSVAVGPVLEREGDLYGPTVNLASRIVSIAFEGSVVVSDEVHDALEESAALGWKALRPRHLKGIGRVRLWVVRRATDAFEAESVRERARRRRGKVRDRVAEFADRRPRGGGDEEE